MNDLKEIKDNIFDRLRIPIITTTIGQVFSGAFIGVKADMQNNPNLNLFKAFKLRYLSNNSNGKFLPGVVNIYRGNFWNYNYTLGCSLIGNNLAQITRGFSQDYTDNYMLQSILSGVSAGFAESSMTTNLVARELSKTTGEKLPNFISSYKMIFLSLFLRDTIGWIAVQAAALHIEKAEKNEPVSTTYKLCTFFGGGITGALVSTPADGNLRRVFNNPTGDSAAKVFKNTIKNYGLFRTVTAGWKPRVASVSPPFIAYGFAQYMLNSRLSDSKQNAKRL